MKPDPRNRALSGLLLASLFAAGLALPALAPAQTVEIATSPMATSTTSLVKPNMLLLLDNSGSMDWEHMPDDDTDLGSSVTFSYGYYGLRSSQCNQVYYNPAITYSPPVYADKTSYANASFNSAWTNGFSTTGNVDLRSAFKASLPAAFTSVAGDSTGGPAYYFNYSGAQTTAVQKDYNSTTNTFYNECHSALNASPGRDVFTKVVLSATATSTTATIAVSGSNSTSVSGITVDGTQQIMDALAAASATPSTLATNIKDRINACTTVQAGNCSGAHGYTATVASSTVTITGLADTVRTLTITRGNSGTMTLSATLLPIANATNNTNFANWHSYYRTRMLMMKTATGLAFKNVSDKYRVGLMKLSASNAPTVPVNTFWNNSDTALGALSTQRTDWYTELYDTAASGSTPLREALSNAGRYYAGKLTGHLAGTATDPLQYSCQQNFTILSTDGFWNGNAGFREDGSSAVGNQDGTAARPMYDGTVGAGTWTNIYTRNDYAKTGTRISGGSNCGTSPQKYRITVQPQICSCTVSAAGADCATACSNSSSTGWNSNGSKVYLSPFTSNSSSCVSSSAADAAMPNPDPSTRVRQSNVQNTTGGSSDSLADVALYYYQTDLRTPALLNCGTPAATGPLCDNNVFMSGVDKNLQQHMNTLTLGLGASGRMIYSSSYLSDTSGDFVAVKLGSTSGGPGGVCPWQAAGTVCDWPVPGMSGTNGLISNIDDLWHAAVNGRGVYFSATDPATLSGGLSSALASVESKVGSAAAAATSTLNPVAGNNFAYVASYTTVKWQGNLEARGINTDTGVVSENATWCVENVAAAACAAPSSFVTDSSGDTPAYFCVTPNAVICSGEMVGTDCRVPAASNCIGTMNSKVTDTTDTRVIKTSSGGTTPTLIDFDTTYRAANAGYFDATLLAGLSQWPTGTDSASVDFRAAAVGDNLLNYLRGQHGHEYDRTTVAAADQLYRKREGVMGDALESQPAFIGAPIFSYPYPGYAEFLAPYDATTNPTGQGGRIGTVYIGTNDGMLHAFASADGIEGWAYIPSMVIPNMWRLADRNYGTKHANYVNGSPITTDICTANCSEPYVAGGSTNPVWKTILVAGLNGGGRGYYALDITNPASPSLMWEITTNAGIGKVKDDDLGYTFGLPVVTRNAAGTWVVLVTSGYDNGTDSPAKSGPTTFVANAPAGDGKGYLYVLNAATGAIISKISTGAGSAAAPSGLAKIAGFNAEPGGNKVSYVYGGDLLGNLWRFDINDAATSAAIGTGSAFKLATLLGPASVAQPITTTPILGVIAGKRIVYIGTGKYLEVSDLTTTPVQTQYAIKDDDATTTLVNARSALVQQFVNLNPDGTATRIGGATAGATTPGTNSMSFAIQRGWFVDFPESRERVNIDAKLVLGTLVVTTIVPSSTECSPGGSGWLNFFDFKTGGAVNPLTGLTSVKYDSTIVGVNVLFIDGQPIVEVVTSTNPTPEKDPNVQFAPAAAGFTGKRVLWRELIPQD